MTLTRVWPDSIPLFWSEIVPIVQRALEHDYDKTSPADLLKRFMLGTFQLWAVFSETASIDCVVVTEILDFPNTSKLHVFLCASVDGTGGDKYYNLGMPVLTEFAREHNCSCLQAYCRKGLARKLDWDHSLCIITKTI